MGLCFVAFYLLALNEEKINGYYMCTLNGHHTQKDGIKFENCIFHLFAQQILSDECSFHLVLPLVLFIRKYTHH